MFELRLEGGGEAVETRMVLADPFFESLVASLGIVVCKMAAL